MKLIKNISSKVEVNEFAWDQTASVLFVTTTNGSIDVYNGTKLHNAPLVQLACHTGPCYCIAIDPLGRYFATGAADALVCLWSVYEMACIRTFSQFDMQLRQVSFSYDGKLLATASEDPHIAIFNVETGEVVHEITCKGPQRTVAWNPKKYLLAYSGEEHSRANSEEGTIHLFKLI
jgi:THO complex subunit 3